ncbi:MAG: phosphoglycerate kinase, partial [Rhizobiales bacterium]|nr:phosphoglycerate kinase [Hyphomicrobiales bacterium]
MADVLVTAVNALNDDNAIRCINYDTPWNFRNRPDYCDALRALRKPSIAAVNGYAFGGGLETAMTCDIRIASENASFAAPEIKLGWIGGGGMAVGLSHAVGPSNAALMIMTGDPIDAATAERWGLVSKVTTRASLMGEAKALAAALQDGEVLILENVRFDARETSKDDAERGSFADELVALTGDNGAFVDDAF